MERPTVFERMLTAASVDETTSTPLGSAIVSRVRELTFYVIAGAGVASGQVILETAPFAEYTGTWSTVATINPAAANTVYHASATGCWGALRARINTVIGGGTVDAYLVGN